MAERVALNSLDYVVAVVADTARRRGWPEDHCVQLVELAGAIDVDRLREAAQVLADRHRLTTAVLDRPWWGWCPSWRLRPGASIPVDALDAPAGVEAREE